MKPAAVRTTTLPPPVLPSRILPPQILPLRVLPLRVLPLAVLLLAGLAACSSGAAAPVQPAPDRSQQASARAAAGPRAYRQVVPPSARSDDGVFTVHRTPDDKLLFEIPDSLLGREMLVVTRIAGVPGEIAGFVVAGHKVHEQVWTWEREGNRVLLRKRSYEQIAQDTLPIAVSVVNNNFPPIVASFPIQAIGPDSASVVVDVTSFYEGDTPAISGVSQSQRRDWGVRRLDTDRSFIVFARAFPQNVDVRSTMTYDATSPPGRNNTGTISMDMHHTMVLLPAEPMRPRFADPRVGYFGINRVNFGVPDQRAVEETVIRRWRLEPSDPAAYARGELVEPVEPIVYYLDPATPHEWRGCVRDGVNDWQAAFETAGFRNAIYALDAPSRDEDPDWDMGDVRYSVVRWAASMVRNAMGPSVSDPRSGEIIESDIVWYHNHMRSYRNRLLLETGAANPRVRGLPIDDELMCDAIRQVIAHEVGHALGLPHNMISSSAYPVESLRDPEFAARMGVAPSIMDYARQNYIAQPGDGLEGTAFIRQIGPYDHHAINWGYRVIDSPTPEAERETLNRWITERAHDPVYRFLPQSAATIADPRAQTEDLGDDAVLASGYGIANLQRVTPQLIEWTTRPGEDYADLGELYGELLGQWHRYVNHVAAQLGGVYADLKTADQTGPVFSGVPRDRQEAALGFLAEQVFDAPTWLNHREILERVGINGFQQLSRRQAAVLSSLLNARRLARLAELEISQPENAYPLAAFLTDLRQAVWRSPVTTAADPYRRALQRAHIEELERLMTEEPQGSPFLGPAPRVSQSDIRPLVRLQLRELRTDAGRAAASGAVANDPVARAHLIDVAERIARILEGPER